MISHVICQYCGMTHTSAGLCHRIKTIEYYPDGTTKSVTLFPLLNTQSGMTFNTPSSDGEKGGNND